MICEERYTTAGVRAGQDYLALCRDRLLPAVRAIGGRILCLTTGLVGDPDNSFLQMTAFDNLPAWQQAQDVYASGRQRLVDSEQVRYDAGALAVAIGLASRVQEL